MKTFLIIICCFSAFIACDENQPLCEKFFRPGHWWPLFVDFQDSKEVKVTTKNFTQVLSPYNNIAYIPVKDSIISVQIETVDNNNATYSKNTDFSVEILESQDSLIGVYQDHVLMKNFMTIQRSHKHFAMISWLPDCWEGMTMFNAIVVSEVITDDRRQKVIAQWVQMGGNLIVVDRTVRQQVYIQNLLEQLVRKESLYEVFGYGLGKVYIFSRSPDIAGWQNFLATNTLAFVQANSIDSIEMETSAPRWQNVVYRMAIGITIVHGILILFWALIYKITRRFIAVSSAQTVLVLLVLLSYFSSYEIVHHEKLSLHQVTPRNSKVLVHSKHHFVPMKDDGYHIYFSHLPFPLTDSAVVMKHTSRKWRITITAPHDTYWRTLYYESLIGDIVVNGDQQTWSVQNASEYHWKDCIFYDGQGVIVLPDCKMGESVSIPLEKTRVPFFVPITSWSPKWLKIFRKFAPENNICVRIEKIHKPLFKTASYQSSDIFVIKNINK